VGLNALKVRGAWGVRSVARALGLVGADGLLTAPRRCNSSALLSSLLRPALLPRVPPLPESEVRAQFPFFPFWCGRFLTLRRVAGREEGAPSSPQAVPAAPLAMAAAAPLPAAVVWVGERIGTCHYPAAQFGGRVYHVSDTVLLQSGLAQPFVCRIERMMQKGARKVMYVRWMFRPPDVPEAAEVLQREPYAQEVFLTDVVEENDLATILARCYVLPPHRYAHLPSAMLDSNVFCCSLLYRAQRETFEAVDESKVKSDVRVRLFGLVLIAVSGGSALHGASRSCSANQHAGGASFGCAVSGVSARPEKEEALQRRSPQQRRAVCRRCQCVLHRQVQKFLLVARASLVGAAARLGVQAAWQVCVRGARAARQASGVAQALSLAQSSQHHCPQ
jgi:hypothetical protein